MNWLSLEFWIHNARFVLLVVLGVGVVAAIYLFHAVLLPFALAIFMAYLLAPLIDWMHTKRISRWYIPRGAAILTVYAVMLGLIALSGMYLFPRFYSELNRLVKTLPETLHNVEERFIEPLEDWLNEWIVTVLPAPPAVEPYGEEIEVKVPVNPPGTVNPVGSVAPPQRSAVEVLAEDYQFIIRKVDEERFEIVAQKKPTVQPADGRHPFQINRQFRAAFTALRQGFEQNLIEFIGLGRKVVRAAVTSVFTLFLVLMLSAFILLDPERIHRFARSMVPNTYHREFDDWLRGLDRGLSGVVRGQVIICLVNGVVTGVGIAVLGVPFVLTLSVLAAVFSLIPIFGVLISTVPILIMALTVSLTTALLALGWILLVHFIEGNFLNPKIMGDSAKIHPVLIVFALLVGEHISGVVGALLAVPVFSLVQNSFLFIKQHAEKLESTT